MNATGDSPLKSIIQQPVEILKIKPHPVYGITGKILELNLLVSLKVFQAV